MSEVVKGILRAISSGLQIPTIIILILLILLTIVMLGSFVAEIVTERKSLKLNIPRLVDDLQGKSTAEMKEIVASSSLLTRQKAAAQELISRVTYPDDTREALARQLIADEESRYNKIVKITDLTARVAPMFGLMGTLIPLGPGLIALGEGDAATLASSLLIAFDTTVAGLISGAISYVISGIRKGWYDQYMIGLETIMETILDVQTTERRKALQQKKAADVAKTGQVGQMVSRDTMVNQSRPAMQAQMAAYQAAPAMQHAMNPAQAQMAAHPAAPAMQQAMNPAQAQMAAHPAAPAMQQAMDPAQAQMAARPAARPAAPAAQAAQAAHPAAQAARPAAPAAQQAMNPAQAAARPAAQAAAAQAARPAAAAAQAARPAMQQGQSIAEQVTRKPSFAEATSKTITGTDAARLQAEVRAAEEALRQAERQAAAESEQQLKSLDDLLESFAPKDGGQ